MALFVPCMYMFVLPARLPDDPYCSTDLIVLMIREPIYHRSNQVFHTFPSFFPLFFSCDGSLRLRLRLLGCSGSGSQSSYGTHLAMILEALAPGGGVATWEAGDLAHVSTAHQTILPLRLLITSLRTLMRRACCQHARICAQR